MSDAPSFWHAHGWQLDTAAACEKKLRRGNGTYLRATKMTTAWSRVSLPLTARAAAWTSNCQWSCSSSIDQSRSPPFCALVRSQLNMVGRDLHTFGAAGGTARATDIEPDKSWSSLGLLLGMSRLSSSCCSSENTRRACDGAGVLCHRSLAPSDGRLTTRPGAHYWCLPHWMGQEGSMCVLIETIFDVF